jgi:hypothetical protein
VSALWIALAIVSASLVGLAMGSPDARSARS